MIRAFYKKWQIVWIFSYLLYLSNKSQHGKSMHRFEISVKNPKYDFLMFLLKKLLVLNKRKNLRINLSLFFDHSISLSNYKLSRGRSEKWMRKLKREYTLKKYWRSKKAWAFLIYNWLWKIWTSNKQLSFQTNQRNVNLICFMFCSKTFLKFYFYSRSVSEKFLFYFWFFLET